MEEQKEALRRKIVEEERQKLLKRHAEELLGYLPKVRLGGNVQWFNQQRYNHPLFSGAASRRGPATF